MYYLGISELTYLITQRLEDQTLVDIFTSLVHDMLKALYYVVTMTGW